MNTANPNPSKINSATVLLLNALMQKLSIYANHMDIQSNVIVALGTSIFVFSASIIRSGQNISGPMLVLIIFSGLAAIIAVFSINPPEFLRKKGQRESLFYQVHISNYTSLEDYSRDLQEMFSSEKRLIEEVAKESYNIAHYSYKPKRLLFDLARNVLVTGFFISFVGFIYQTFFR